MTSRTLATRLVPRVGASVGSRDPGTRSLVRNSLSLVVTTLVTSGLGYASWILVARFLDPATVGLASAVISFSTVVSLATHLGVGPLLIRRLPAVEGRPEWLASLVSALLVSSGLTGLAGLGLGILAVRCGWFAGVFEQPALGVEVRQQVERDGFALAVGVGLGLPVVRHLQDGRPRQAAMRDQRGFAEYRAAAAGFDFDHGNAVTGIIYMKLAAVSRANNTGSSPVNRDSTILLEVPWFDAIAPYHPTAVGAYSNLGRRPAARFVRLRSGRGIEKISRSQGMPSQEVRGVQRSAALALQPLRGHLRVHDPGARGHPLDVAGADRAAVAL